MQKEGGINKLKRICYVRQGTFPLGRSVGLIRQITSLVLSRKFLTDWFKILLLGEAATEIRLVIKFWLSEVA